MTTMNEAGRDLVFVSYSHADATWLERLKIHLQPLERRGAIEVWDDRRIHAGARWREEIGSALARARVAVLLVSPEFLASDFIASHELPELLGAEKGLKAVIWVPVRPSNYAATELDGYQAAFDPRRTLAEMDEAEADRALVGVSEQIVKAYQDGPVAASGSGPVAGHGSGRRGVGVGRGRFAVALVGLALAAAVAWLAAQRSPAAIPVPERPEAGQPLPPPPDVTVINGNVVQNVGPGGNAVVGKQVNVGSEPRPEGK